MKRGELEMVVEELRNQAEQRELPMLRKYLSSLAEVTAEALAVLDHCQANGVRVFSDVDGRDISSGEHGSEGQKETQGGPSSAAGPVQLAVPAASFSPGCDSAQVRAVAGVPPSGAPATRSEAEGEEYCPRCFNGLVGNYCGHCKCYPNGRWG